MFSFEEHTTNGSYSDTPIIRCDHLKNVDDESERKVESETDRQTDRQTDRVQTETSRERGGGGGRWWGDT